MFTTNIAITRPRTILVTTAISVPQLLFGPASKVLPQPFYDEKYDDRERPRVRGSGPATNVVHAWRRCDCCAHWDYYQARKCEARKCPGKRLRVAQQLSLVLIRSIMLARGTSFHLTFGRRAWKVLHRCSNLHRMSVERQKVSDMGESESDRCCTVVWKVGRVVEGLEV